MRFFFDRSVGKAVPTALREDGIDAVIHDEIFDPNTSIDDATWIRYATERRAFVESGARMVLLGGKATRWEMLRVFRLALPRIARLVEAQSAPWIQFIDENGRAHPRYPEPPRRRRPRK